MFLEASFSDTHILLDISLCQGEYPESSACLTFTGTCDYKELGNPGRCSEDWGGARRCKGTLGGVVKTEEEQEDARSLKRGKRTNGEQQCLCH